MAYNLKALIRGKGVRRQSIVCRPQYTTIEQEVALAKAVLMPARVWAANNQAILVAYESALNTAVTTDSNDDLHAAILAVSEAGLTATVTATQIVSAWLAEFQERHARRFAAGIKSATRVDPFPYINIDANKEDIDAFQRRMTSLITDTNDTLRKEVSELTWKGVINRTPTREVGRAIAERMQIARNRANFIASDQANKVNAFLTEIRQEEAGIDEFMWETAKDTRVRPEHAVLQGRVFKWKKPPSVGLPGTPSRCRCTGAAFINLSS